MTDLNERTERIRRLARITLDATAERDWASLEQLANAVAAFDEFQQQSAALGVLLASDYNETWWTLETILAVLMESDDRAISDRDRVSIEVAVGRLRAQVTSLSTA